LVQAVLTSADAPQATPVVAAIAHAVIESAHRHEAVVVLVMVGSMRLNAMVLH